MKQLLQLCVVGASVAFAACAQSSAPAAAVPAAAVVAPAPDVMADLSKDAAGVQKKIIDLAKAMPEATYSWRPMPGVRSVREVMLHITGENYLMPALFGVAVPASLGISGSDAKSVETFEKRTISKDSVVAELTASFDNLNKAMAAEGTAKLGESVDFFGTKLTRQYSWIAIVTHLHEHLGQSIAYARQNKIVPPWSK